MDRDNGEIYDVCTGRDATALRAVMIEPCTEKKQNMFAKCWTAIMCGNYFSMSHPSFDAEGNSGENQ